MSSRTPDRDQGGDPNQDPSYSHENPNESNSQSPIPKTLENPSSPNLENPSPKKIDHNNRPPHILLDNDQALDDQEPTESLQLSVVITTAANTASAAPAVTFRRCNSKRKKAAMKRLKAEKKSQQKLESLLKTFKPVPFIPNKALDFSSHQTLLERLGLWDFVHLDLDKVIRTDLVAQLIATYSKTERCSYVNGVKIMVNRADLARALRLPKKKEKLSLGFVENVDEEVETEEAVGFVVDFVSNWVLLHDDTWMMPDEIMNWIKCVKEGKFEKVDWAGMVWFMVEKELMQAPDLDNCYYASHLQFLIRFQKEELLSLPTSSVEEVDVKDEEEEDGRSMKMNELDEQSLKTGDLEEHSLELSLGNENASKVDGDEKEGTSVELGLGKDDAVESEKAAEENAELAVREEVQVGSVKEGKLDEMEHEKDTVKKEDGGGVVLGGMDDVMDSEECKEEEEEHDNQWGLDGRNKSNEFLLRNCSFSGVDVEYGLSQGEEAEAEEGEGEEAEEQEIEEEDGEEMEEEAEDEEQENEQGFHISPKFSDLEGLSSGHLMEVMGTGQHPFGSGLQIRDSTCGEFLASRSDNQPILGSSSIFAGTNKRELDHDNSLLPHSLNVSNKRMRTEGVWDGKSADFNTCMEQMQHWLEKARMAHEAKEQIYAESNMNQQIFLNELQQRDALIDHLQKVRAEEQQKLQNEIYRLERELYMMMNLLGGYKKALKETDKAFAEYRARYGEQDEPLYKDVPGSGGLVLSVMELDRQRVKQEEEKKMLLSMLKGKMKEFEDGWIVRFDTYLERVNVLRSRVATAQNEVKLVNELVPKRKQQETAKLSDNERDAETPVQEECETVVVTVASGVEAVKDEGNAEAALTDGIEAATEEVGNREAAVQAEAEAAAAAQAEAEAEAAAQAEAEAEAEAAAQPEAEAEAAAQPEAEAEAEAAAQPEAEAEAVSTEEENVDAAAMEE